MTKLPSGAPVPRFPVHDRNVAEKILAHFREPVPIEKKILPEIEPKPIIPPKLKFKEKIGTAPIIADRLIDCCEFLAYQAYQ